MAFISLDAGELVQDKPFTTDLALQIKDNFDALNGSLTSLASSDIPNGSFEVDSDSDGLPDNWTRATYPGGTVERETTTVAHGEASIKMVHPGGGGNGGGYATSDYVACSEFYPVVLQMIHWATAAEMKNQVIFYWYTAAKVACAVPSTTVYDSTANPTTATLLICGATPPATARFFKVRLVGGESSVNVAGTAYFDGAARTALYSPTLLNISEGTLAEQTLTSTEAFTDRGSFTIVPRVAGHPIKLTFSAEIRKTTGGGFQRFRVGADYSNNGPSGSGTGYETRLYSIILTDTPAGGAITVTQQLSIISGTLYGRKLTTSGSTGQPQTNFV